MSEAHTLTQDLRWCLNTPSLLSATELVFEQGHALIESPDLPYSRQVNSPSFASLLKSRTCQGRVGLYYEQLWAALLEEARHEHPVLRNAQVFQNRQTLGALDLVSCHNGHLIHRELAAKFYLATQRGSRLEEWIGPNAGDCLADKINHLIHHQLPLFYHPHTEAVLATWLSAQQLDFPGNWVRESRVLMQGYLFRHALAGDALTPHPLVNVSQIKGIWCHAHELRTCMSRYQAIGGRIIPRMNWLSGEPATNESPTDPLSLAQQVRDHFRLPGAGGLMIRLFRKTNAGIEQINERLMLVSDHWPLRSSAQLEESQPGPT